MCFFIKPEYPLPLDPEMFLGRMDAATLIDLGYADAKSYMENMSEEGIPFTPEATMMREAPSPDYRLKNQSPLVWLWEKLRFWD